MCRCTKARVLFVLGLLECFCFSGLMFGWHVISSNMAHDGFFSELCRDHSPALPESLVHQYNVVPFQIGNFSATLITATPDVANDMEEQMRNHSGFVQMADAASSAPSDYTGDSPDGSTCPAQRIALWRVYAVAVTLCGLLSFPVGLVFDLCGTLKLRLVAIFLFTTATFLLTFTAPGVSWLLYPSWCLLGVGGSVILLTNLQICNYFPTWRNTVLLCCFGAYQSSAYVVVVIKTSADSGLNIQTSFLFLTVGIVPLLVNTIAFLPRTHLPWPMPSEYCELPDSISTYIRRKRLCAPHVTDAQEPVPVKKMSFRAILTSRLYLTQIVWFSLSMLSLNVTRVYGSFTTDRTGDLSDHVMLLGLVSVVPIGLMLDRCSRTGQDSARRQSIMRSLSAVCTLLLVAILCMAILLVSTPSDNNGIVFIIEALTRPVLLGTNAIILSTIYPFENFGRLYGLCLAIAEVVSSLQYTIVTSQFPSHNAVTILCVALLLACCVYPWLLWKQSTAHYFDIMTSSPPEVQSSRPINQRRSSTCSTRLTAIGDESRM